MPAECDVPLRKGWFYHPDEKAKSVDELFSLFLQSVGRGAALDLGLAPDTRGLLDEGDVEVLRAFGKKMEETFRINYLRAANLRASNVRGYNTIYGTKNLLDGRDETYWATDDDFPTPYLTMTFNQPITFDLFQMKEHIRLGQRIEEFVLEVDDNGQWKEIHKGTSVGARRIVKFDTPITAQKIRLRITKCPVAVVISEMGIYKEAN